MIDNLAFDLTDKIVSTDEFNLFLKGIGNPRTRLFIDKTASAHSVKIRLLLLRGPLSDNERSWCKWLERKPSPISPNIR